MHVHVCVYLCVCMCEGLDLTINPISPISPKPINLHPRPKTL